jgi:hypothetical protein
MSGDPKIFVSTQKSNDASVAEELGSEGTRTASVEVLGSGWFIVN